MKRFLKQFGLILSLILALAGAFLAGVSTNQESWAATANPMLGVDFAPFWRAWELVDEKFVDEERVASSTVETERVYGAISGMVWALDDPYTVFLPPAEKKVFEENINGNFGGVGIEIDIVNQVLTVISALDTTPAKKAGLLANDQIIAVDGRNTAEMSIDEAIDLIRGEIGTTVTLTIFRAGETKPQEFEITRALISIPTVKTEVKDGVFIIKLFSFNNDAANLFRRALRDFVSSRNNKLILDLRSNPGGYLESAVEMASWFLPAGKTVVIERSRQAAEDKIHNSYGYNIFDDNLKMVVLVDGGSASAAEILAGALSEHKVATLVGEKTFGKGSVQELIKITKDSSLKLTVAKWYTPNGVSLSDEGLEPDVLVERLSIDERKKGSVSAEAEDPQLTRALEIVRGL